MPPIADLVYNADIARKPTISQSERGENEMSENIMDNYKCECKPEVGYGWIPVPPPMPTPMPTPCPPFYPPYPAPPMPPFDPDVEPDKGSVSQKICKLSRKANIITKMLENLETKKKDVIINVGGVSYNFGNIDLDLGDGWLDGSYAATVKKILEYELGLIKTKIAELAEEIGEEASESSGIEGTVGG